MTNRARERQLAKLAARRQAGRAAAQRKRAAIVGSTIGLIVIVGITVGAIKFFGGKEDKATGPSASSSIPTPTAAQTVGTGKPTGSVTPQPAPKKVACGAKAPANAADPIAQYDGPPPMKINLKKTYVATIDTSCGKVQVQLDAKSAPQTVNSFVFLSDKGFYDGQYFHRLDTSIDVIQGGDPLGTGVGGPGYTIPDEYTGQEKYPPGTFALAHSSAANSGGSQFFIITGPNGAKLPPQYTVFGQVMSGMDILKKVQQMPITDAAAAAQGDLTGQAPKEAIYINSITISVK